LRLVVKLGGTLLDDDATRVRLGGELAEAARQHQVVVVHGGGKRLSRELAERGIQSRFVNGFRVTTPETLATAVHVLAGEVNLELVGAIEQAGGRGVGLTGADAGLVQAEQLTPELGAVGKIQRVLPDLLELLTGRGYIPVVACLAGGIRGEVYNVNADQMAVACGVYFRADQLVFLTDVEGVLDQDHQLIGCLEPAEAETLIERRVASGGMEAKLRASAAAVRQGVGLVSIAPGARPGVVAEILSGQPVGTRISLR